MKNLLLLFILSFVTSILGCAQQIPEKANTITITLSDASSANEKVLKVLTGKDYTIKDKSESNINTMPKTIKNNTRVAMYVKMNGAEITLTGKISMAAQGNMPIEYKGNKGTPIMNAWEEMEKVAKAFGGKMKYEVK